MDLFNCSFENSKDTSKHKSSNHYYYQTRSMKPFGKQTVFQLLYLICHAGFSANSLLQTAANLLHLLLQQCPNHHHSNANHWNQINKSTTKCNPLPLSKRIRVWLLVAVLHDSLLDLSLLSCATACCVVERFDLTIMKAALSLSLVQIHSGSAVTGSEWRPKFNWDFFVQWHTLEKFSWRSSQ